jgi:hypothetical protein
LAFNSRQRSNRAAELAKKLSTFAVVLVEVAMVFTPGFGTCGNCLPMRSGTDDLGQARHGSPAA